MRKFYISTIATDAAEAAHKHGMGLEIAEFCTARKMDEQFRETDAAVRKKLEGIEKSVLHAPFNELFPCAIDPKARTLAAERYRQAIDLAVKYGAEKVVIHGGYNPWIFYPVWYVEQSIEFWKAFLADAPDAIIVLENVLEETPDNWTDTVCPTDSSNAGERFKIKAYQAHKSEEVIVWFCQTGTIVKRISRVIPFLSITN